MREILFKAKRISDGKWIEGYYFKAKWHWHEKGIHADWLLVSATQNGGRCNINQRYAIDGKTICQYTGLKDKNGNKIWENDILNGHKNPKDLAKVVFGEFCVIDVETLEKVDGVIGWHTETIPTDAISRAEPFCLPMPLTDFYVELSEWEVIGNIFDNPELEKE